MSLSSSLYTGVSGLQTAQNALNTISHNLANANTKGYTRQQIQLSDRSYIKDNTLNRSTNGGQIGEGVKYARCKQVRDTFLDKSYRNEAGKQGFYETLCGSTDEVESLLQELYGTTFYDSLNAFSESVEELLKNPTDNVSQSVFVARASQMLTQSKDLYDGLSQYQINLDSQVAEAAKRINTIGDRIYALNKEISKIEAAKKESANDLRDERNNLLDELAQMGRITYDEDIHGYVTVLFEDNTFVNETCVNHIGTDFKNENGLIDLYWEREAKFHIEDGKRTVDSIDGARVVRLDNLNSQSFDNGKLKGLLLMRGDKKGTYEDLDLDYETKIAPSIIMNMQAEFDNLVHSLVTKINDVMEASSANPGKENGNTKDYLLFIDVSGKEKYSIENVYINDLYLENPNAFTFKTDDGLDDFETAQKLVDVFNKKDFLLNPASDVKISIMDGYNELVSQVASFGNVYKSVLETQEKTVSSIDNERSQVTGVSTDEELATMIQYQNMYNASSRYINVVNEMMDHIITKLV